MVNPKPPLTGKELYDIAKQHPELYPNGFVFKDGWWLADRGPGEDNAPGSPHIESLMLAKANEKMGLTGDRRWTDLRAAMKMYSIRPVDLI